MDRPLIYRKHLAQAIELKWEYVLAVKGSHVIARTADSGLRAELTIKAIDFNPDGHGPASWDDVELVFADIWAMVPWLPKEFRMPMLCACGCGEPAADRSQYAHGSTCRARVHRAAKAEAEANAEEDPPMWAMPGLSVILHKSGHVVYPSGIEPVTLGTDLEETRWRMVHELAVMNERMQISNGWSEELQAFFERQGLQRMHARLLDASRWSGSQGLVVLRVAAYFNRGLPKYYFASPSENVWYGPFLTEWEAILVALRWRLQLPDDTLVADIYAGWSRLFPGNPKGVAHGLIKAWLKRDPPKPEKPLSPVEIAIVEYLSTAPDYSRHLGAIKFRANISGKNSEKDVEKALRRLCKAGIVRREKQSYGYDHYVNDETKMLHGTEDHD